MTTKFFTFARLEKATGMRLFYTVVATALFIGTLDFQQG